MHTIDKHIWLANLPYFLKQLPMEPPRDVLKEAINTPANCKKSARLPFYELTHECRLGLYHRNIWRKSIIPNTAELMVSIFCSVITDLANSHFVHVVPKRVST